MGKQWKQWPTLFFWAPKSLQMVTAAMKLKRRLLFGRKVMTNLESILKSRDITLPTKVRLVKSMVFPVIMYGCESWTIKKAERQNDMTLKDEIPRSIDVQYAPSYEIKRHLLLERKVMTNLESILRSRDVTLPKKVHLVKAMVFPVVMYGCKSCGKKVMLTPTNIIAKWILAHVSLRV